MKRSHFAAVLVSALAPCLVSALSDSDIESVFGQGAANLTGGAVQLPQFLYTVVTNSSHALVSLNATTSKPSQVGWMATAIGTAMANGDFLITWPNPAQAGASGAANKITWTLSHRATTGQEAQPVVASTDPASSTAALFHLVDALSTSDPDSSFTVVSYIRELTFPSSLSATTFKPLSRASTTFLYASSTVQPGNSAESAVLTQHNQAHATTKLDLSKAITLSSTGTATSTSTGGAPSSTGAGTGFQAATNKFNRRDKLLIAHAVLGSVAFLILIPFGISIGRYLRSFTWFPAHVGIQLLAAALVIACYAIGTKENAEGSPKGGHQALGLALFILVLVQVIGGAFAHRIRCDRDAVLHSVLPTLTGKSPVRLAHIFLGITITVLGIAQVNMGFDQWNQQNSIGKSVPRGVKIVYWILVGVIASTYIAGWVLEIAGTKKRRAAPYTGGAEKVGSSAQQ